MRANRCFRLEIKVDNANMPSPRALLVVGPATYSVDGVGVADPSAMFDVLQAHRIEHLEMRIEADARTDYDRIGKLIFSLARQGWQAESPDRLHWTLKPAAH